MSCKGTLTIKCVKEKNCYVSIYPGIYTSLSRQNFEIPIRIHANNRIDSIANIVYLSAKERTAEAFARFYLHGASASISGYKKDLEEAVNSLEVENERIAQYVADNTRLSIGEVSKMMEKRGSKSAQEALGFGIVKSITHLEILPGETNRIDVPYIVSGHKIK